MADPDILETAQKRCFEFRKSELPKEVSEEIKKINTHRLEQGWAKSVSTVANAPEFKYAFDAVGENMARLDKSFIKRG